MITDAQRDELLALLPWGATIRRVRMFKGAPTRYVCEDFDNEGFRRIRWVTERPYQNIERSIAAFGEAYWLLTPVAWWGNRAFPPLKFRGYHELENVVYYLRDLWHQKALFSTLIPDRPRLRAPEQERNPYPPGWSKERIERHAVAIREGFKLSPKRRARALLMRRNGLTLQQIGDRMGGLSRERVRQILIKAENKERADLRRDSSEHLEDGWERLSQPTLRRLHKTVDALWCNPPKRFLSRLFPHLRKAA